MKKISFSVLACSLFVSACVHAQQRTDIELNGPYTLILLGQKVSQMYQRKQPGVTIRVQGGSAQSAVSQVLKGQIDIAQSHGDVRSEAARELLAVPIGVEGIVIYVNASNPVNDITLAQLHGIYTGEILNWKQLGGPDQRIAVYGGDSTSSMNSYFAEAVLRGDTTFSYMGKTSTKDLLDAVASHPDAVGFAGMGLAPHVKALRIRSGAGSKAIEPSYDSIRSLEYPISRYIYWRLAREPRGVLRDFCEWMLSQEGQLVVEGVGFLPLPPEMRMVARQRLGLPAMGGPATHGGN